MGLLPGRRYGDPPWFDPASHTEDDQALWSKSSYEEDRVNNYQRSPAAKEVGGERFIFTP